MSAGKVGGGLSLGAIVIAAIIYFTTGDFNQAASVLGDQTTTEQVSNYQPTAEEEELATFASQILAGTEDVWTAIFKQNGLTYEPPKLVLFSGSVNSGCGSATAQSGPFYCSADQAVYIDLSFFSPCVSSSEQQAILRTPTLSPTRWDIMCNICSEPSTPLIGRCNR